MSLSPPPITEPKLVEIDNALAELDPTFEQFGGAHGFTFARGNAGSANIPRRWLTRILPGLVHQIGLVITSSIVERLERGFYPAIPCTLYIQAQLLPNPSWGSQVYDTEIVEAEPFSALVHSLPRYLAEARSQLDTCTVEFVTQHGRAYRFKGVK